MRAMKNYAGNRLSPWLGHLMVSRSETARQLMTPGEIMQLPPDDEIVMIAGVPQVRAKKARYFTDRRFTSRLLPAHTTQRATTAPRPDDWTVLAPPQQPVLAYPASANDASRKNRKAGVWGKRVTRRRDTGGRRI